MASHAAVCCVWIVSVAVGAGAHECASLPRATPRAAFCRLAACARAFLVHGGECGRGRELILSIAV